MSGKAAVMLKSSWLDDSFIFYASYHDNMINQLIHIVCVWPILFTAFIMLCFTPPLFTSLPALGLASPHLLTVDLSSLPSSLLGSSTTINITCNWCFLVASLYFTYYALIEGRIGGAGTLAALLIVLLYMVANLLHQQHGEAVWVYALYGHVACWVAQFVGHGAFEGRSPALFSNLFQALAMAPLFVLMEVMFMFGYRPDFRSRVQKVVDVDVAEFKKAKASKQVNKAK